MHSSGARKLKSLVEKINLCKELSKMKLADMEKDVNPFVIGSLLGDQFFGASDEDIFGDSTLEFRPKSN